MDLNSHPSPGMQIDGSPLQQVRTSEERNALVTISSGSNGYRVAMNSPRHNYWVVENFNASTTLSNGSTKIGAWITQDIGHVVILEKMKFWHYGPFQDDYSFRDGTILTSLTGEDGTWEEIHFIQRTPSNVTMSIYADNRDDNGEWEEYNIAANKQFPSRYYRLVTSIEPDQGIVFLHEWHLFGKMASTPAGTYIVSPTGGSGTGLELKTIVGDNAVIEEIEVMTNPTTPYSINDELTLNIDGKDLVIKLDEAITNNYEITPQNIKDAGFSARELGLGYPLQEIKSTGFTIDDLKAENFT